MDRKASAQGYPDWLKTHVRVIGTSLADDSRIYIKQKLGQKLRKFASSVERASVRVTDVNGPRGGQDQLCTIKVVMPGLVTVVVERRHANVRTAVGAALRAAEQSVQQLIGKRRRKPLHPRRRSTTASRSR